MRSDRPIGRLWFGTARVAITGLALGLALPCHAQLSTPGKAWEPGDMAPEPILPHCELISRDLPPGHPPPRFDASRWNVFGVRSNVTFTVTFQSPSTPLTPFASQITSNLLAAAARWGQLLDAPTPVTLEILVRFNPNIPRATGGSATTGFVATRNGFNIFEQGAAFEVRTGIDPNGGTPDINIDLSQGYTTNELWFDPNPATRTTPVPSNRTDAVSVFLHELGHAFSFNGWRDNFNGTLPGNFMSPFDELTTFAGDFFFGGVQATSLYAGPVPLTFGNAKHVGNQLPRPGSDLIPDLMNGVVFFRGQRYDISPMTLAVSRDVGVRLTPPPPACDSLDFNNDGDFPTPLDLEDFIAANAGNVCATCSTDLDFNNDGDFPTPLDIEAFVRVNAGGGCQ